MRSELCAVAPCRRQRAGRISRAHLPPQRPSRRGRRAGRLGPAPRGRLRRRGGGAAAAPGAWTGAGAGGLSGAGRRFICLPQLWARELPGRPAGRPLGSEIGGRGGAWGDFKVLSGDCALKGRGWPALLGCSRLWERRAARLGQQRLCGDVAPLPGSPRAVWGTERCHDLQASTSRKQMSNKLRESPHGIVLTN